MLKYTHILTLSIALSLVACGKRDDQAQVTISPKSAPIPTPHTQDNSAKGEVQSAAELEKMRITCVESWRKWSEQYSTGSSLTAFEKSDLTGTAKVDLSKENLKQLLSDLPFTLPQPEDLNQRVIINTDQIESATLDRFLGSSERDIKISQNIESIVHSALATDLVIVFAGISHSADYFLQHLDEDIQYAGFPANKQTQISSDRYYRFWKDIGLAKHMQFFEPNLITMEWLLKLAAYKKAGFKMKESQLTDSRLSSSHVIMLQDVHGINVQQTAIDLPKEECVPLLGFNQVTVAVEGLAYKNITREEVVNNLNPKRELSTENLEKIQKISPSAYELIQNGDLGIYPEFDALMDKLESYEKSGLVKVKYFGIE